MALVRRNAALILMLVSMSVLLAGCSGRAEMTYVSSDRTLEPSGLQEAFSDIDAPVFLGRPVTDAPDLRHSALASLRSQGSAQSDLADLLTEVFPSDGRSVPHYAEEARVDGRDAWVVIELWGPAGGTLDRGRAWAFDRTTGDVIVSITFR